MPHAETPPDTAPAAMGWRGLAPRIFGVIALLTLVSAVLATLAVQLLGAANQRLVSTESFAERGIAAGRGTVNMLQFARSVEALPLPLPAEERARWEATAQDEMTRMERRLDQLDRTTQLQASHEHLAKIRPILAEYKAAHLKVRDLARQNKLDEATAAAMAAAPLIEKMRRELRALEDLVTTTMRENVAIANEEAGSARVLMIGLAGGGSAFAIALALWIVMRGITGPLKRLAGTANQLAAGAIDDPTPETGRRDEVGAIARGLETLRGAALHARALEADARATEQQVAEEARAGRQALAARVEAELGSVMARLGDATQRLEGTIGQLTGNADDAAHRANSVANAAGQASANVQTVSAAAEELAASVTEITRQVSQAAAVARQAVGEAQAADTTVTSLNEAAARIGVVVQLIGEIAGQTNLLALNATIEAARAGDAGKGFAVVASEVKQLASQTGKATEEIGQQITAIQEATNRAVQSIRGISTVVNQVDQIAASIAAAVEEQGAATQEIARSVAEAATGTGEVSANISHVSNGVNATRDALDGMRATTAEVAQQNTTLRTEMETLTRSLRAA